MKSIIQFDTWQDMLTHLPGDASSRLLADVSALDLWLRGELTRKGCDFLETKRALRWRIGEGSGNSDADITVSLEKEVVIGGSAPILAYHDHRPAIVRAEEAVTGGGYWNEEGGRGVGWSTSSVTQLYGQDALCYLAEKLLPTTT